MAEEFIVDWKVDQPAILAGQQREEVYALVTIRPNISVLGPLLESNTATSLPAHLVVIVDVSGSMNILIRDDPNARPVGHRTSEGRNVTVVETDVPCRSEVAQNVVRKLAERLEPSDRMTLVAFDHHAYVLASALGRGAELTRAIDSLATTGGGGTSMGRGIEAAIRSITAQDNNSTTCKVVVLTDGEDQEESFALSQARVLGDEYRIPVHAFGTGESVGTFLMEVQKATFGGTYRNITDEHQAETDFDEVLKNQKSTLATNVTLSLWLSPEILVKDLYRTKPEILYNDRIRPDSENQIDVPIVYMERGKVYEFLFHCEVPERDAGRFRLGKATLHYDVPALDVRGETTSTNIVVEYTTDAERAAVRVGDVRRVISQAEVQRQVLFLTETIKLIESGDANPKHRQVIGRLLGKLIAKFEELGDKANQNHYERMKADYLAKGTISQQSLNQSLAASSKVAQEVGVVNIDDVF